MTFLGNLKNEILEPQASSPGLSGIILEHFGALPRKIKMSLREGRPPPRPSLRVFILLAAQILVYNVYPMYRHTYIVTCFL